MEYFIETGFIDLKATFSCGQCFRWEEVGGAYSGAAGGRKAFAREEKGGVALSGISEGDIPFWKRYFCAHEDYRSLIETFSADETLKAACAFALGIRVLWQEPFETLISFIISQNNNIGRIKGIISRLCERFGENGAFPEPERLAVSGKDDLAFLRAGFRDRYILDAAGRVASGEIRLDKIADMPYNSGKAELMKIVGVGEKVADCVLLFGFHKTEAFPRDVWMKRVMSAYYPNGLPDCVKGYEGIAQQFLFHYARSAGFSGARTARG
ncbi:MAG: DNA-3-methyladenine glycosylase 2 [Oscillospiraceae bacterium]|jgi:N-glycosylase/DNA lyase|nr:DNA-3-methyladenine glycosylase 2 [Oscillospiraceae bacterium]